MKALSRRRTSGLLVIAAALSTLAVYLYLDQTHEQAAVDADSESLQALQYDLWSNAIRTVRYNAQGYPDYILEAARQVHYLDNRSELESPALQWFEDQQLRWQVEAGSGTLFGASEEGMEQLDLRNNVQVRYNDSSGQVLSMFTEFLTLEGEARILHTAEPVQLRSTGFEQQSIGIRADLERDSVEFPAQVQGRYYDALPESMRLQSRENENVEPSP